jgi:geranylgeranyl pyrophosphate synthase
LDLAANGKQLTLPDVERMHALKTGALIRASVLMAAACAHGLSTAIHAALDRYAQDVGLAFQIQDDLLDVEGDAAVLGKPTGADREHDKPTYPAVAGIEQARTRMHELHASALRALQELGPRADCLASLSDWLVLRRF